MSQHILRLTVVAECEIILDIDTDDYDVDLNGIIEAEQRNLDRDPASVFNSVDANWHVDVEDITDSTTDQQVTNGD